MGFIARNILYFSGTIASGYMTGVIQKSMLRVTFVICSMSRKYAFNMAKAILIPRIIKNCTVSRMGMIYSQLKYGDFP
ncbi:MAG: hypothetical protein BWY84_01240 [Candidatus Aerophobetes bacterium ADurb.Bin490]|nr:MAG: hypothetical protein BWY84_01240 [Candidatus Aerophobetes bacterium ADurb.Bin490]